MHYIGAAEREALLLPLMAELAALLPRAKIAIEMCGTLGADRRPPPVTFDGRQVYRYVPLRAVTCRYVPLRTVRYRYIPLHTL